MDKHTKEKKRPGEKEDLERLKIRTRKITFRRGAGAGRGGWEMWGEREIEANINGATKASDRSQILGFQRMWESVD